MSLIPLRSVLYMPGTNPRALEKAKTLDTDAVVFDLEDAVSPAAKAEARARVCDAAQSGDYGDRYLVIRINALDTPWGETDLAAAIDAGPNAILVPKVSYGDDARTISTQIANTGSSHTRLWVMIETAMAILNVNAIAATSRDDDSRLSCLMLGTNDIAKETGASMANNRAAMLPWLSQCVVAAKAYGLGIIDGVANDFRDMPSLEQECIHGRDLGMDGKSLIHPNQIDTANRIFSPNDATVAWARRVIAEFDKPKNAAINVLSIDGAMVERLHAQMARKTLEFVERIQRSD